MYSSSASFALVAENSQPIHMSNSYNQAEFASPIMDTAVEKKEPLQAVPKLNSIVEFGIEFSKKNSKASKKLPRNCTVTVHDYGPDKYDKNEFIFPEEQQPLNPSTILANLPSLQFEKPTWATVRWIDVEGFNPEMVQFLLRLVECERQYAFNNIVDTKQRVMGLLLDGAGADEDNSKFLLVTKVASLIQGAADQLNGEVSCNKLYEVNSISDFEQISYLLKVDLPDNAAGPDAPPLESGVLISFQEGKTGDVFGEIRAQLQIQGSKERRRGVSYLLMQLVRASCESASDIEHYIEDALEQLAAAMAADTGSLRLNSKARMIEGVCDEMRRVMLPFAETLDWMTHDKFPRHLLGSNPVTWGDLHMQLHRLTDNIQGSQATAQGLVEGYRDLQAKQAENVSFSMGLVLAVFSPLTFISGIYGMNFNGTMPELNWTNENSTVTGYQYFWILIGVVVAGTLLLYMAAGLIPGPMALVRKLSGRND